MAVVIADANVLIDYAKSDRTVLELFSKHLGTITVPRPLLREVAQLDEGECLRLGLVLVDGSVEQLIEAAKRRGKGGLSFEDCLCLILARDSGWVCLSNDRPLRKLCQEEGIEVRWGLSLMLDLVLGELLPSVEAIKIAQAIQASNPRYITKKIVAEFARKLRAHRK